MPVIFTEHDHKYVNYQGVQYTSVTTLIGKYKQPFDPHKITYNNKSLVQNYADKHGNTVDYWLEKWDKTRDEACERGTAFHKKKEDYFNGRGAVVFRNQVSFVRNAIPVIESYGDLAMLQDGLYPELLLWLDPFKLAGQADVVNIETVGSTRYVDLDDHKTNGKIDLISYAKRGTNNHKMMMYPLHKIMDCNYFHYELQMSFYMYMLEMFGFTPRTMRFTHYPHEDEKGRTPPPVVYELQYRRKEVVELLNHHKRTEYERNRKTA